MIGEILQAVLQEVKALLSDTGGQIMLKTNFQPKKLPDYTYPLILLSIDDAPESVQYPGGLTQMDWKFGFNSYNYEPDAYVDDDSGFSTSLLNLPIDTIRQHFSTYGATGWLTQGMADMFNTYGLQFTLMGVTNADALDQDGLAMGFKITFDTTAFDNTTDFLEQIEDIQTITQVNNPPFKPNDPIS